MPKHQNSFIKAALEAMDQEANTDSTQQVTEVAIVAPDDAVAELMEKNAVLEDNNAQLQEESFDNDTEAVVGVSDSINQDLEDVVKAGSALEQLAELCEYTARSGLANTATLASHVFALEQICEGIGLASPVPALEAETLQLEGPKEKTESIGAKAVEGAKELGRRLIEGIKRVLGWIIGVIRALVLRGEKISSKAQELLTRIDSIDSSKQIDAKPFIISLKLVQGGGSPSDQFDNYFKTATKTLYGFFNSSFKANLEQAAKATGTPEEVRSKLSKVLQAAFDNIYTENGTSGDVATEVPKEVQESNLVVGLTKPCVGGLQLYLASTLENGEVFYARAGAVEKEAVFDAPDSIPVVEKALAKQGLVLVKKWVADQKELEKTMAGLSNVQIPSTVTSDAVAHYLRVLSSLVTGSAPHLLRLNLKNAAAFVAYVDKSITASTAGTASTAEK